MSCLILADMSLSDQIAIELAHADRQTLTVEGELAKLEQMLGMRKDRAAERAQQFPVRRAAPHAAGQPSTPAATPDCRAALPSERVVAGTYSPEPSA